MHSFVKHTVYLLEITTFVYFCIFKISFSPFLFELRVQCLNRNFFFLINQALVKNAKQFNLSIQFCHLLL